MKISIGISAYNEEKNIKNIIINVLNQEQDSWKLEELLIYSDGSTDNTVLEVLKIKDKRVRLIDDKKRLGKSYRLKQMFNDFRGDYLVMLDADIELLNTKVISNLIKPFKSDNEIVLVGGNSWPYIPKTFFQKSVYSTFLVFYRSRKYIKNGNNIFGCTGSIMAIQNEFARKINLPNVFNEDAYIYLKCISLGYKFRYVDNAIVLYKLPTNLRDHIKQVFRSDPVAVNTELHKYFGDLVDKEFYRPIHFYVLSIFLVFLKYPLNLINIVIINGICKIFIPFVSKNYKLEWFTAASTH